MASSEGKTYQEMGEVIKQAKKDGKSADEIKKLNDTRDSLFKGDSLRGILLNAYGWWLIGTIAIWAGAALLVVALILAVFSFTVLRERRRPKQIRKKARSTDCRPGFFVAILPLASSREALHYHRDHTAPCQTRS